MPTIYDIDFEKFAVEMAPPDKRFDRTAAWLKCLLNPAQYLRDTFFGEYRTGSDAQEWVNSSPYNKYDNVKYKFAVYESLIDNNSEVPTTQTAWRLLLTSSIGVEERLLYTGNKLLFEYAINKQFGTVFRQPPNTSDIYITVLPKPFSVFIIGADENQSSVNYSNVSSEFIINDYDFNAYFNMNINVPVAVYNALDTVPANCEKIIRNYANQYIVAGIIHQIITY